MTADQVVDGVLWGRVWPKVVAAKARMPLPVAAENDDEHPGFRRVPELIHGGPL